MSARLAPRVSAAILERPPGRFHVEADPGPLSTPQSDGAKLGGVSVDVVDGHAEPIRELARTNELERRRPCAIEQFDRATRYPIRIGASLALRCAMSARLAPRVSAAIL